MQSITALAHLKACILYFIDISEECGYSIEQQVNLYKSIEPLFVGKPIVVILNKIDVKKPEDLNEYQKGLIKSIETEKISLVPMSNISEEGISQVKQIACDKLLQQRTEVILNSQKNDDILKRVHVAMPVPRDDKERPVHDPQVDKEKQLDKVKEKQTEWEFQQKLYKELDPDYKGMDWKEDYIVEDEEWKHDRIPEIMNGKNVFDFWNGDVEEKLDELEMEEVSRLRALDELMKDDDINQYKLTPEQQEKVKRIREKRKLLVNDSRFRKGIDKPRIPKKYNTKNYTISDLEAHLESLGMDSSLVSGRLRSESRPRSQTRGRKREKELSTEREVSITPLPGEGYRNVKQKLLAEKLAKNSMKHLTRDGRMGDSDRHVYDWMPKHLYSGKRGVGSNDRR